VGGDSLVEFLRASATQRPQAEALVDGERRLTYSELWRDVGRRAAFLRSRIQPGDRVALLLENSIEYVSAYYGTLAAGGVVVALNQAARQRDLSNWIAHAQARLLIGDPRHAEWKQVVQACAPEVDIVQLGDAPAPELASRVIAWSVAVFDEVSEPVTGDPDSPAAIIYTSGTTGRPKGVVLSQRNLAANVRSIQQYLALTENDSILNVLPFYYSYGNSVLHTHLAAGARILLENTLAYPHRTLERMVRERVTGFSGVPSTYALLMNRVALEDYDLSALRYMTQAGGAMPAASVARLTQRLPRVRFFVMYGQTEASARLSYLPPESLEAKLGSAGRAIPGVTLEIRGEDGQALPRGTVGEIWARGDNVMLGYWRDPETTATVLRDGWLRTGDLAHMDQDGYLFIEGRRSDMIKSGAHRINPKDIEEVIAEIGGVAEVVVIGVDDEILGQVIKAIVIPAPGKALDAMAIKAHCRDRLAVYKIPKQIEFAAELPKTASGKIKRFELASGRGQVSA
jgi:long-chain acyl-CoA synthetase